MSQKPGKDNSCKGYAQIGGEPARGIGSDELLEVFAEGDSYIAHALVEDMELAYECSNGTTFEAIVFRSCEFERVDFRDSTFRDVRFENCRFFNCAMDKAWLNRVDFSGCSALGLSLLQARLAGVYACDTDFSYANISETSIDQLCLKSCRLIEVALQRAKLKRVVLQECNLTRLDVFGTKLAGIDLSTCVFQAPVLSADYHELRGAIVAPEQAVDLALLLGVRLKVD